ncbi:hypothetical protein V6Z12_A06G132100 [Gossypium hirsutum]
MSNITKLEFVALDITGNNYLSWVLDVEIHLDAKGLGETIKEGNEESTQDKPKAMIFLRHHLHEARYEWLNLRLQDFKFVSDYNSAMFRITSQLNLCREKITDAEMLEKTYSTFHANNVVLQTQYYEKGFQKYFELISCLLVAEQNNELLMKNHELHPTGSAPFPEANVSLHNGQELKETHHANSSVRGHGRGRGRGRGHRYGYGRGGRFKTSHSYQKWDRKNGKRKKKVKCD